MKNYDACKTCAYQRAKGRQEPAGAVRTAANVPDPRLVLWKRTKEGERK